MLKHQPTLQIVCGKIASGKSTLSSQLAAEQGTVLVAEDDWLNVLFADELHSLEDFVRCSGKLRDIMGTHVGALLESGISVVLDFAANTRGSWASSRRPVFRTRCTFSTSRTMFVWQGCARGMRSEITHSKSPTTIFGSSPAISPRLRKTRDSPSFDIATAKKLFRTIQAHDRSLG